MQSRLLSVVVALISKVPIASRAKSSSATYWVDYYSLPDLSISSSIRGLASATRAGRTADPTVHAEDFDADPVATQGTPEGPDDGVANEKPVEEVDSGRRRCRGTEPLSPPKPRYAAGSSPRLESTGVSQQPLDPTFQQKRSFAKTTSLEDLSCAGLDGSPWPEDKGTDRRADRNKQQEDEREYYKHHKASPLSEIKVADTRKPIDREEERRGAAGGDVVGWKRVQLETAEQTLLRAARIFKENAMRGDPDAPQSKVLKLLLRARSGNPDSAPKYVNGLDI